jgi:hypothetical protein
VNHSTLEAVLCEKEPQLLQPWPVSDFGIHPTILSYFSYQLAKKTFRDRSLVVGCLLQLPVGHQLPGIQRLPCDWAQPLVLQRLLDHRAARPVPLRSHHRVGTHTPASHTSEWQHWPLSRHGLPGRAQHVLVPLAQWCPSQHDRVAWQLCRVVPLRRVVDGAGAPRYVCTTRGRNYCIPKGRAAGRRLASQCMQKC